MLETVELQRQALDTPVEPRFVHKSPNVKGLYTTGDYVRWKMNQVFGPDHWSHEVLQGPEIISLNDQNAYVQVKVRLTAIFVNGLVVTHDDVGVSVLQASRGGGLDNTAPERYETVLKSAITDGIKACAEYLGICFRPLADDTLEVEIRRDRERQAQPSPRPEALTPTARIPIEKRASALHTTEETPVVVEQPLEPAVDTTPARSSRRKGSDQPANPAIESEAVAGKAGGRLRQESGTKANGGNGNGEAKDHNGAKSSGEAATPTDFWSRFNELKRSGQIDARIISAEEIAEAKRSGDWAKALAWLNDQVKAPEQA